MHAIIAPISDILLFSRSDCEDEGKLCAIFYTGEGLLCGDFFEKTRCLEGCF